MRRGATTFAATLMLLLCFAPVVPAWAGDRANEPQREEQPKAKAGSKDDIEAIGNRDIGGRGLGNWYSLEGEIRMGREYAQMVDTSTKLVQDPIVTEYVNRIGQNIVYVHSGLLLAADEEAELAGVVAHEVAHVAARHATRQMTRAQFADIASIPLIFVGGGAGYAARSAAGIGLPMSFLKFSRGFEEEADYLGLQYMYKTGYDPQSFMTFFEKIQAREKVKPGTLSKIFASHPSIVSRIAQTQNQLETKLPSRSEYVVTRSEFDEVRTRLAMLENRRQIPGEQKETKPTLRRGPKTSQDPNAEDDRPKLKRRED